MQRALGSYRDLKVWRAGMELVRLCYRSSAHFPKHELYGLSGQMRRAAVSIPANIAEGYGRLHRGDYLRYLSVANGSLKELETEIQIATDLEYLSQEELHELSVIAAHVGRMLRALTRKLTHNSSHPTPSHPAPSR